MGLCVLIAFALTGCGTQSTFQRGSDTIPLVNAIVLDDVGYVRDAVGSGAVSVNQRIPAPGYLEGTPLITIAAKSGSLEVLLYLIRAGADLNARTPVDETALMLACYFMEDGGFLRGPSYERHEQAARMLVAAGADLESAPYGYTALSYAAYQGRDRTVRFLLERGARIDGDTDDGISYTPTPLMMTSIMGHTNLAVTLLRAGANPRIRVKNGLTARELAVKYQHGSVARALACAETLAPGEAFAARCQ